MTVRSRNLKRQIVCHPYSLRSLVDTEQPHGARQHLASARSGMGRSDTESRTDSDDCGVPCSACV